MDLSDYIDQVFECVTVEQLNAVLTETFGEIGAVALVGHALPFGGARTADRWSPIISTYPDAVNRAYKAQAAGDDPVMNAALALGAPVHFSKIARSLAWTDRTKRVFKAMSKAGINDAVSTPVFAKPGVYAYFAAGYPSIQTHFSEADLRRIKICFSEYFFRYRDLTRAHRQTLSKREREVLVAITNNKSNAEIASDLGVSEHTVETYVKRCFVKLDVSNRTEAVIKCYGVGLGRSAQS